MTLTGKTVAILVEQQYQEMELWYPLYRKCPVTGRLVSSGRPVAFSPEGPPHVRHRTPDRRNRSDR